jgi:hypothetical protein
VTIKVPQGITTETRSFTLENHKGEQILAFEGQSDASFSFSPSELVGASVVLTETRVDSFLQRLDEVVLANVRLQSLNAGDTIAFEINEPIVQEKEPFFFGIFQ